LPGGIGPVTWSGTFTSDTRGVSMQWQWAGAACTQFGGVPTSASSNALGLKPVDDSQLSVFKNSDHPGTPENFRDS
jgi:hypothetical protein